MSRPEFLFKGAQRVESIPLGHIISKWGTKGAVGIEVEVEGNKFPKPSDMGGRKVAPMPEWKYWSYTKDGSLRGQDNAEYVLTNPIAFKDVPDAVKELSTRLADYGSVLADSNRTSVHVHLNCQEFYLNQLASLSALWYCFEDMLTEFSGEHRVGNLFCLRGKDAPAVIRRLKNFLNTESTSEVDSDGLHYAGYNVQALPKFGSVEIRTMRGPTDLSLITTWVSILQRLYDLSATFPDPRGITDMFSQYGPEYFINHVLGEYALTVKTALSWSDEQMRNSVYEGIRLAQDLCYCRDWDLFDPIPVVVDPFGRIKSRKPLSGVEAGLQAMDGWSNSPPSVASNSSSLQGLVQSLSEDAMAEPEDYYDEED